jgi:hypothetical protein
MFGEQVSKIILGVLEPHPKFLFRQTYDVADLAESIRKVGQLQPGRVVPRPDGKGYWVYIGVRRYFALKLLYDQAKTEEERRSFLNFKAFIDEATEEEMAIRALHENEGDKEERIRVELTPLEKVIILKSFELKNVALGKHYEKLRNIPLSIEQMKNLQKIEKETGYKFELNALEYLAEIARNGDNELYLTAAEIARNEYKSKEKMKIAYEARVEATGWEWFRKLFPTITVHDAFFDQLSELRNQILGGKGGRHEKGGEGEGKGKGEGEGGTTAGESEEGKAKGGSEGHAPSPAQGEEGSPAPQPEPSTPLYTVQDALVVRCPYCSTPHIVELAELRISSKIHDPAGSSPIPIPNPIDMEQVVGVSPAIKCVCGENYYLTVKKEEGRYYALTSKRAVRVLQEAKPTEPIPLMTWDTEGQCWVVHGAGGAVLKKIEVKHNHR